MDKAWTVSILRDHARGYDDYKASITKKEDLAALLRRHGLDLSKPPSGAPSVVHKGWNIRLLRERARAFDDYKASITKKNDLVALIRGHGVDLSVAPESVEETPLHLRTVPALLAIARLREGFKKAIHARNKTTLLQFLGAAATAPAQQKEEPESIQEIRRKVNEKVYKRGDVLRIARSIGWPNAKGRIDELLEFIEKTPPAAAGAPPQWPIVDLESVSRLSIPQIKDILRRHEITEALPTKKADLLKLFTKKRCGPSDLTACDKKEVCDTRNKLCRDDLGATKSTRLVEYIFQGRRFWGSQDIIEEIKKAVVAHEEEAPVEEESRGGVEETKESGPPRTRALSPVRVSNIIEDETLHLDAVREAIRLIVEEGMRINKVCEAVGISYHCYNDWTHG
ncbi:MAG: hypothetical protein EBT69_06935, partial [Verrucomicrobia bacterium]|nr:hypothetical protein [Verrucomicrobiota bacterium]